MCKFNIIYLTSQGHGVNGSNRVEKEVQIQLQKCVDNQWAAKTL